MSTAHKLLIVGGGAGGLELATGLGSSRVLGKNPRVCMTLLDGRPTHIWKPLLHEVATGSFNSGQDELNYFSHSSENNYKFLLGWMGGLDRAKKVVKVDPLRVGGKTLISNAREIPYDTLVLAIGSVADTFGTPGAREHCMFLNSPREADAIRFRLLLKGLSVLYGAAKVPKIRVGIVGAGATGVELAAEIYRTIKALGITGFKLSQLEITVLEAGPAILAMAGPELSNLAMEEMTKRGIEVKTNVKIQKVTEDGFVLGDGKLLEKEIRIWTAGVRAPRWLGKVGLQTNAASRVLANKFLKSIDDPDIFLLGDCGCVPLLEEGDYKMSLPTTAQVAHQQAKWLRETLRKRILDGTTPRRPFKYRPHGFLLSLGETTAVGSVKFVRGFKDYQVKGALAKGLYVTLYRKHQMEIMGTPKMLSLLIGDKFRHMAMPELKFH